MSAPIQREAYAAHSSAGDAAPLSLYLHIPFCDHKCSYCDFNSYAGLDRMIPAFTDALVCELERWSTALPARPMPSVFFGGGTPSLLPLADLGRLLTTLRACFRLDADAEITLEANPGTVDRAYLRGLHDLGVNRLSIGVQSLDDGELLALDRIHDAATARRAYADARAAGFTNINLDFIYGLAGQTLAGWRTTLARALELAPEHLSLYALTVEEGTGLAAQIARGRAPEPDPDLQAAMYEHTEERMAAAGYEHYEISNWAQPGRECQHNLVYWQDGEWLGVGPGAHSHLGDRRFAVLRSPGGYIQSLQLPLRSGAQPEERMPQVESIERADEHTQRADAAMLALRLARGLDERAFAARFGITADEAFPGVLAECAALGLVERADGVTRLTARGRLLSNEVFLRLL